MMDVEVTTDDVHNSSQNRQLTNTQFLHAGYPSCRPTNSVRALKGKQVEKQ